MTELFLYLSLKYGLMVKILFRLKRRCYSRKVYICSYSQWNICTWDISPLCSMEMLGLCPAMVNWHICHLMAHAPWPSIIIRIILSPFFATHQTSRVSLLCVLEDSIFPWDSVPMWRHRLLVHCSTIKYGVAIQSSEAMASILLDPIDLKDDSEEDSSPYKVA